MPIELHKIYDVQADAEFYINLNRINWIKPLEDGFFLVLINGHRFYITESTLKTLTGEKKNVDTCNSSEPNTDTTLPYTNGLSVCTEPNE